jgi:hypothetical protein
MTGGVDVNRIGLSSVEKYSPTSDTWTTLLPLPEPRSNHVAVAVGSAMYVLGGIAGEDPAPIMTASALKLDTLQGIWSTVAPMPELRFDFASGVVGSDIYVFGGISATSRDQGSVFKYGTETDIWSTLAPMPTVASGHSAIELDGLIYVVGVGESKSGLILYDPALEVWTTLAPLIYRCPFGTSFVLGGCLYAAGGKSNECAMHRYDVTANTWTEVADMLQGRYRLCAVKIGGSGPAEEQGLFDSLIVKAARRRP